MTEINGSESLSGFEVLAFFVADHGVVENGKVYVNGGFFDRVYYPVFPMPLSIAVVSLIKVSPERFQRDYQFIIQMEEADASQPIVRIEGNLRAVPSPDSEPGEPSLVPLAVPLTGLSLPRADEYWFVLYLNNNEAARYRMRAVQVGMVTQILPQTPAGDGGGQQAE